MWEVKVTVVPIVVGALETVPLRFKGDRSRHINFLKSEVCIAGVSKITKKSTGNVIVRKENHVVFLDNLLLPGTMTLPAVVI